jgi:hypothetical protein
MYNKDGQMVACKTQWFPLSERRFDGAPTLRQAWVKRNGCALSHSDFTSKKFLCLLPKLLDVMDESYIENPDLIEGPKELVLHIEDVYQ